jgi:hypothetical protein
MVTYDEKCHIRNSAVKILDSTKGGRCVVIRRRRVMFFLKLVYVNDYIRYIFMDQSRILPQLSSFLSCVVHVDTMAFENSNHGTLQPQQITS